ncbi:hypothetical protein PG984_005727 [Apiospora sp. TS-2023a]
MRELERDPTVRRGKEFVLNTVLPMMCLGTSVHPRILVDMVVPFFHVNLWWIDATSTNRSQWINDVEYTDVSKKSFTNRGAGAVTIIRDTKWLPQKWDPKIDITLSPRIFTGKRTVAIKILTMNKGATLPEGQT